MHKMIFACFIAGQQDIPKAVILGESIRSFAGEFSASPIWLMVPQRSKKLSGNVRAKINALDIKLHLFELYPQEADFPFAGKVVASAAAESLALDQADQLVWMDTMSMVINPPKKLLLDQDTLLGCRSVDHILIGSPFEKPLDPFWESVYQSCGVTDNDIFPMITSKDRVKIRPYINAGMLVVRPEHKLLQHWRDNFLYIYQNSRYMDFYEQNHLFKIFIHQAVLSASVIASIDQIEIMELPDFVNYPLHMHAEYPIEHRPTSLNDLITLRYEQFFSKPNWQDIIQVEPPLKDRLTEREGVLARG
ncbi:hypothetical protein ACFLY4_07920 [Chloroflexota bacterium]